MLSYVPWFTSQPNIPTRLHHACTRMPGNACGIQYHTPDTAPSARQMHKCFLEVSTEWPVPLTCSPINTRLHSRPQEHRACVHSLGSTLTEPWHFPIPATGQSLGAVHMQPLFQNHGWFEVRERRLGRCPTGHEAVFTTSHVASGVCQPDPHCSLVPLRPPHEPAQGPGSPLLLALTREPCLLSIEPALWEVCVDTGGGLVCPWHPRGAVPPGRILAQEAACSFACRQECENQSIGRQHAELL